MVLWTAKEKQSDARLLHMCFLLPVAVVKTWPEYCSGVWPLPFPVASQLGARSAMRTVGSDLLCSHIPQAAHTQAQRLQSGLVGQYSVCVFVWV